MSGPGVFILSVLWRDGSREAQSEHPDLRAAATEAFRLADELSQPGYPKAAREVAVTQGGTLQLSIAIDPGKPLTGVTE